MEQIEFFKKLRDTSDLVAKAIENGNTEEIENALGRFMLLMVKLDALK
ncbi:hypothetical protein CACET_c31910 [Clostridium aceticum]|uniref:Uncharacterized protein n=1 Tax=Clostridium aceticum TaxID=84022 RepID=A0A0G3WFI8_9CLOT|nr:hypothetical protein [Clostridium aceticum]AKL96635.1 hypothetical protein CACET_c31910 [Clostridium aceticum]